MHSFRYYLADFIDSDINKASQGFHLMLAWSNIPYIDKRRLAYQDTLWLINWFLVYLWMPFYLQGL
jgi:hypothetical protein